jgi:leucyl aminopeptidase
MAAPGRSRYFDQLKSEIADFTNTGGRPGGAITAALFLKEFTGGCRAHYIAGTAGLKRRAYLPKGPSGLRSDANRAGIHRTSGRSEWPVETGSSIWILK